MATPDTNAFSNETYKRVVLLSVIGALALTLGSKLSLPFNPVPMTLQLLAMGLIVTFLPGRLVITSLVLWLAVGFVAPVHAMPGLTTVQVISGPTGGYVLGMTFAACASILMMTDAGKLLVILFMTYFIGLIWLWGHVPASQLLEFGFFPLITADAFQIALALFLGLKLSEARDRLRAWAFGPPGR